jgi:hypothetical protein
MSPSISKPSTKRPFFVFRGRDLAIEPTQSNFARELYRLIFILNVPFPQVRGEKPFHFIAPLFSVAGNEMLFST